MRLALDDIVQELLPETQNIPEADVKTALILALRSFCDCSQIWREECECVVVSATGTAEVSLPPHAEAIYCQYIRLDGMKGIIRNPALLDVNGSVDVSNEYSSSRGQVTRGKAMMILQPAYSADVIDSVMYRRWQQGIKAGAIFNLRSMYGREWYEPNVAAFNMQEFQRAIGAASREAMNKYLASEGRAEVGWI